MNAQHKQRQLWRNAPETDVPYNGITVTLTVTARIVTVTDKASAGHLSFICLAWLTSIQCGHTWRMRNMPSNCNFPSSPGLLGLSVSRLVFFSFQSQFFFTVQHTYRMQVHACFARYKSLQGLHFSANQRNAQSSLSPPSPPVPRPAAQKCNYIGQRKRRGGRGMSFFMPPLGIPNLKQSLGS